jgi:hypothetical protein
VITLQAKSAAEPCVYADRAPQLKAIVMLLTSLAEVGKKI